VHFIKISEKIAFGMIVDFPCVLSFEIILRESFAWLRLLQICLACWPAVARFEGTGNSVIVFGKCSQCERLRNISSS